MHPAACISQTIASKFGSSILWAKAGLQSLHNLDLFSTPDRPGFNGRQAFGKDTDLFYSAMKSVTSLSTTLMRSYDDERRSRGTLPKNVAVAFPTIVVDAPLFEAYFDGGAGTMKLDRVPRIRCHWQGAPDWKAHATVDVVCADNLEEFVRLRRSEVVTLLSVLSISREEIVACFQNRSLNDLEIVDGPRGTLGLDLLLQEALNETSGAT